MDVFLSLLTLVGGLALFLYGMEVMGDGLKKLAGGKLESILSKLTANRFLGFLLGFIVTGIIQSSSATIVMLVGFVNSGIMKLAQTIGIIMGANIGTTVTAWLLSTSAINADAAAWLQLFKPSAFTPILALVGVIMLMMGKSDKKKHIASILLGFAVLMFGMESMSGAMESNEAIKTAVSQSMLMFKNPFAGILIGTILTVIIQSSSVSVGILQALSLSVNIPFSTAFPIILGENIGATITPVISSISGNTSAKRVAAACVYIKMIGVTIVYAVFYVLDIIFDFSFMSVYVTPLTIAIAHTLFNVVSTIILIPFCGLIEKLAVKTIKSNEQERETDVFDTLDARFLDIPSFAVECCRDLVCDMAKVTKRSFDKATKLLEEYQQSEFEAVEELEAQIDKYEDKTSTYLVKIASQQLSVKDSKMVTELLHCIGDIERISDHALSIAKAAKEVYQKKITFSDKAKSDLAIITGAVSEILDLSIEVLVNDNIATAKHVEPLEQVIDRLKRKIKNGHISRLRQGDCTMELGFVLSDLLTNYERIADHCSNIAVCFIEITNDSFETHEYLNQVKSGEEAEFVDMYESYKQKYYIK